MSFVIPAPAQPWLPVQGQDGGRFPIRRVYCVGQNYAAHALEMGAKPERERPFFFCKPREAVFCGSEFAYPEGSNDVQFEIELMLALRAGGQRIPAHKALECIYGYAVGLDMTRRELQAAAKKAGRPWETSKAFDGSGPCSAITPSSMIGHPSQGAIWLDVNGERRQTGDLEQMIWKIPEIIEQLSLLFTLQAGDLIFTGTPSGVGPITVGDVMHGSVEGVAEIEFRVV